MKLTYERERGIQNANANKRVPVVAHEGLFGEIEQHVRGLVATMVRAGEALRGCPRGAVHTPGEARHAVEEVHGVSIVVDGDW